MDRERPNVLLVIADQMTPRLTGAYGHPIVQTPHLERLCREGVRFDAAYSNYTLCAPARATMMAGRYASRLRAYDNGTPFAPETPTFAHTLRRAGYEVAASGKMHFIGPDQLHGIERRLTTDIYPANFGWVSDWERDRREGIENVKGFFASDCGERVWTRQLNYDEEVQARALDFLRARRADTYNRAEAPRPFCLMVSYTHPHTPFQITREYMERYAEADIEPPASPDEARGADIEMDKWLRRYEGISEEVLRDPKRMRAMRQAYFGMVSYVDDKVGELVKALEDLGMKDETAIVFTSDHGEMLGERGFVEKRVFYEDSARIPLICSWPERWRTGAVVADPVSLIDFYPTLAEFCDETTPEDVEGVSFLDLLENEEPIIDTTREPIRQSDEEPIIPKRFAIAEYHAEGVLVPCFMVRKDTLKYVYVHGGGEQLFDLANDPGELRNLAQEPAFAERKALLKKPILERFDPDAVERDVLERQASLRYVHDALFAGTTTQWDLTPEYDGRTMYDR